MGSDRKIRLGWCCTVKYLREWTFLEKPSKFQVREEKIAWEASLKELSDTRSLNHWYEEPNGLWCGGKGFGMEHILVVCLVQLGEGLFRLVGEILVFCGADFFWEGEFL